VNRVLGLAEKPFVELELEAAVAMKDEARAKAKRMRLWEIDMASLGSQYADWRRYAGLSSPDEFVKGMWLGKAAAKENMLLADRSVINNALTKAQSGNAQFKKLAKDMNKGVLAYVLGKPNGEQLACEALQLASRSDAAKNELFCQLLKACSKSGKVEDVARALDLLRVGMWAFAPECVVARGRRLAGGGELTPTRRWQARAGEVCVFVCAEEGRGKVRGRGQPRKVRVQGRASGQ
jgi:hypothetical protein